MYGRTEYAVVSSMDEREFIEKVNKCLEEGYFLQGGVECQGACLLQAVTREVYEEDPVTGPGPAPEAEPDAASSEEKKKAVASNKKKRT